MKQRQIEFRVWDTIRKQMEYQLDKTLVAEDGTEFQITVFRFTSADTWSNPLVTLTKALRHPERYKVMQYTGLKDVRGLKIFEGDIIRTDLDPEDGFENPDAVVYDEDLRGFTACGLGLEHSRTVIGNLYQNPELVKSK